MQVQSSMTETATAHAPAAALDAVEWRRPDPVAVAEWVQANNLLKSPPFWVDRFGLYSSWQGPEGSVYRLERAYLL